MNENSKIQLLCDDLSEIELLIYRNMNNWIDVIDKRREYHKIISDKISVT